MSSSGLPLGGAKAHSRSVGARARIQNIIADARASLKEPSRPVTPQTLEQRTQLFSSSLSLSERERETERERERDRREQIAASYNHALLKAKRASSHTHTAAASSSLSSAGRDRDRDREKSASYAAANSSSSSHKTHSPVDLSREKEESEEDEDDDDDDDTTSNKYSSHAGMNMNVNRNNNSSNNNNNNKDYEENNDEEDEEESSQHTHTTAAAAEAVAVSERERRSSAAAQETRLSLREFVSKLRELRSLLRESERDSRTELDKELRALSDASERLMESVKNCKGTSAALSSQDLFDAHLSLWELVSETQSLLDTHTHRRLLSLCLRHCVHTFPADALSLSLTHSPSQTQTHTHKRDDDPVHTMPSRNAGSLSLSLIARLAQALFSSASSSTDKEVQDERDSLSLTDAERDREREVALDTTHFALTQLSLFLDLAHKNCSEETSHSHSEHLSSDVKGKSKSSSNSPTILVSLCLAERLCASLALSWLCSTVAYGASALRARAGESDKERERLVKARCVESVCVRGVRVFEKNTALVALLHTHNRCESEREREARADSLLQTRAESIVCVRAVVRRVSSALSQLLCLVRNLSLSSVARNALLSTSSSSQSSGRGSGGLAVRLCVCLSQYRLCPEVALNGTRVLAKLSLYESFRTQISSSTSSHSSGNSTGSHVSRNRCLEALLGVVKVEARRCRAVMERCESEREDDEEEEDDEVWPAWHTWPVVSRAAFTLGNLTTSNENNRALLGASEDGLSSILLLLQVCVSSLTRLHAHKQQRSHTPTVFGFGNLMNAGNPYVSLDEEEDLEVDQQAEVELRDATVKLVRLLANLCIDSAAGLIVGSKHENLQMLLDIITICDQSAEQEEMLLNAIAALTNLTFYSCQALTTSPSSSSSTSSTSNSLDAKAAARLDRTLVLLSTQLCEALFHENTEIVLEAARVMGNLSRRTSVVANLIARRADEALLLLFLKHVHPEIVSAAGGVIVNFSSHSEGRRRMLLSDVTQCSTNSVYVGGSMVMKLAAMLRRLTMQDVPIAVLLSQILHNLIGSREFSECREREDVSPERIELILREWMDIAQDLIRDYAHLSPENGGFSEEDLLSYQQFSKIAHSIISLLVTQSQSTNIKK